jgi:hypothetical protein
LLMPKKHLRCGKMFRFLKKLDICLNIKNSLNKTKEILLNLSARSMVNLSLMLTVIFSEDMKL